MTTKAFSHTNKPSIQLSDNYAKILHDETFIGIVGGKFHHGSLTQSIHRERKNEKEEQQQYNLQQKIFLNTIRWYHMKPCQIRMIVCTLYLCY